MHAPPALAGCRIAAGFTLAPRRPAGRAGTYVLFARTPVTRAAAHSSWPLLTLLRNLSRFPSG